MHARMNVMCPNCCVEGEEKPHWNKELNVFQSRIGILPPKVSVISDLDWQDGKTGDTEYSHALGKEIRSRRQLKEAKLRAREALYEATDGEHTVMKPVLKDPDDPSSISYEPHTTTKQGHDMGEIYEHETLPERINDPKSSFEEGKTLRETEKKLENSVGKDEE